MKRAFDYLAPMAAALILTAAGISHAQTPSQATDVAVYRGDSGHAGFIDTDVPAGLAVLWQNTTTAASQNQSSPALVNGVLYFGSGSHVYAVNAADGSLKWQYPTTTTTTTDNFSCSGTVADGKLYIGSDGNKLSVLDVSSGALLWEQATRGAVRSAPTVDGNVVFFGGSDNYLYAIRTDSQQPVWGGEFHTNGPVSTSPIVVNGYVYFADGDSNIYGVNEANGRLVWTFRPTGGVTDGSPVYADGNLYVGSSRQLYVLSSRTGSIRTTIPLVSDIVGPPTVGNGYVYVGTSDQSVYCLTSRGDTIWHAKLDEIANNPFLLTRNMLFAVTQRGVLYALDAKSGGKRWIYQFQAAAQTGGGGPDQALARTTVTAAPIAANGAVYTLANDGTLTAFRIDAPDNLAPLVGKHYPEVGSTVPGANIPYQITVSDPASGIDPASVHLKIDGMTIPVSYDSSTSMVTVQQHQATPGSLNETAYVLSTLPDGDRHAVLTARDWRGNNLTKEWIFTVDNSLNPPDALPPTPIVTDPPAAAGATASGVTPDSSSDSAAPSPGVTTGGTIGVSPSTGANGTAAGGGSSSGAGAGGGSAAGGGGTAGGTPGTNFGTPKNGGGGGGATTGGGGVPPPPPI